MYQSTGAEDAAAIVVSAVQDEPEPDEAAKPAVQSAAAAAFHGTTHADVFHTNRMRNLRDFFI